MEKTDKTERWMALVFLAATSISIAFSFASPVNRAIMSGQRINTLAFGLDSVEGQHRTDTIVLASYEPVQNRIDLISIPRDTLITFYPYKNHRINEIFAAYDRETKDKNQAAQKLIEAVTTLISSGTVKPEITGYAGIDYAGFEHIIDLLGGINVRVDEYMHYEDKSGNLKIDLPPGNYHLYGKDALKYIRFRGQSGDRGRILRQHDFVRHILKASYNPLLIFKIPQITMLATRNFYTNMSLWDMIAFIFEAKKIKPENLCWHILPGKTSGPYWKVEPGWTNFVARQITGGISGDIKLNSGFPSQKITVKVWNATDRPGLAELMTAKVRQAGFDVLEWGNYDTRQYKTAVIDRIGDMKTAWSVAQVVGTDNVLSELNPTSYTNTEVILGNDSIF